MGTQWGVGRRYTPLGPDPGGGRPVRWLLAFALAGALVALKLGAFSGEPGVVTAKAWVVRATGTPVGMKAPWAEAVSRLENFLRGGLGGHGWHWPPVHGGMRVRVPKAQFTPMSYPVAGVLLVPFGGGRDPVSGRYVASDGIVLGAEAGAPVVAPCTGTVAAVLAGPPVGEEVEIRPSSRATVTVDLLGVENVRVHAGQTVMRGEAVGAVPTLGPREVPTIIMEVRIRGIAVDPLSPLFLGPAE